MGCSDQHFNGVQHTELKGKKSGIVGELHRTRGMLNEGPYKVSSIDFPEVLGFIGWISFHRLAAMSVLN